jgi:hypothetical protein
MNGSMAALDATLCRHMERLRVHERVRTKRMAEQ